MKNIQHWPLMTARFWHAPEKFASRQTKKEVISRFLRLEKSAGTFVIPFVSRLGLAMAAPETTATRKPRRAVGIEIFIPFESFCVSEIQLGFFGRMVSNDDDSNFLESLALQGMKREVR